jgi:hypothetical protein
MACVYCRGCACIVSVLSNTRPGSSHPFSKCTAATSAYEMLRTLAANHPALMVRYV